MIPRDPHEHEIIKYFPTNIIRIALVIQLAVLVLVGLATLGFDIPVLRQIIGFIYLAFIPGLLILYILKLHGLWWIETLLYSVGLSIFFVMFLGFFINILYPILGISKPISIVPVLATITIFVLILCIIAYTREGSKSVISLQNVGIRRSDLFSSPVLFLLLLPVLSVLGAHLVYAHQGNTVLLLLLSLIVLAVILIAFNKFIPAKFYPLAIIAIGIALEWHWSLISPGFFGTDIHHEYFAQNLVLSNSFWDPTIHSNVNAMLSIVMLAPIYSLVLNMKTVWIFKIIYPLIYSLVPLALFQAYRKQTNDNVAFFAAFFFMSMPVFFSQMMDLARQQIAELFFALSILLFLDKEMKPLKRAALLIIFGLSIIVSHYALAYIYVFYLLVSYFLLLLWGSGTVKRLYGSFKTLDTHLQKNTLSATFVTLLIVFCLAWYLYVSSGSAFCAITRIGDHIYSSMINDFFNSGTRDPFVRQALGLDPMRVPDVEWQIARIFQYLTQLFIVVGFLWLIANWRKSKFHPEFIAMCLVSLGILVFSIVAPFFSQALEMTRLYHLTLFFLAPFYILGGMAIFQRLFKAFPRYRHLSSVSPSYCLILVVTLVSLPYFLFTTGFIFDITGAAPGSQSLSAHKADWPICTDSDYQTIQWVEKHIEDGATIYTEGFGSRMLFYSGMRGYTKRRSWDLERFPHSPGNISTESYIYLRSWNILHGEAHILNIIKYSNSFRDKIYNNGQAQVIGHLTRKP